LKLHERKVGKKTEKYRVYDSRHLGPGEMLKFTKLWLLAALALPWLLIPALVLHLLGFGSWMAYILPIVLAGALGCGYIASSAQGQIDPL
jgi:hypothetical protein